MEQILYFIVISNWQQKMCTHMQSPVAMPADAVMPLQSSISMLMKHRRYLRAYSWLKIASWPFNPILDLCVATQFVSGFHQSVLIFVLVCVYFIFIFYVSLAVHTLMWPLYCVFICVFLCIWDFELVSCSLVYGFGFTLRGAQSAIHRVYVYKNMQMEQGCYRITAPPHTSDWWTVWILPPDIGFVELIDSFLSNSVKAVDVM